MDYTEQIEDPVDSNGNALSAYRSHPFLKRYDVVGVTAGKLVVMFDGTHTQTALLDEDRSITMLEEHELWGDSVAEFVVQFAGEFGPWKHVNPDVVEEIAHGSVPDVDVPDAADVIFTSHAREQWQVRGIDGVPIEDAWEEGLLIDGPFDEDTVARFHPDSTCTFVADPPSVITVFPPIANLSPGRRRAIYDELPDDYE